MAVNASRSMSTELAEGRTDGSIQKVARDRAGEVDAGTFNARRSLHPDYGYGTRDRAVLGIKADEFFHGDESLPPRHS